LIKRFLDIFIAVVSILCLIPVYGIVFILVRIFLGKPVFFVQERPGLYGKIFKIYKFRTMQNQYDASGNLLPDGDRLNRFGRFLRASSLDEIPTFWNVLKGDMSLVGPRPLLVEYLPRYSQEQMRRHEVKPGITGLAQISGRNDIAWKDKFVLDVWYVDHHSARLDLKILFYTVFYVIRAKGINLAGCATTNKFE
jgi:sugar transferase EpsL